MDTNNLNFNYYVLVKCDAYKREREAEFSAIDIFFTEYEAQNKINSIKQTINTINKYENGYEIEEHRCTSDKIFVHDKKNKNHYLVYTIQKVTTKNRLTAVWQHLGNSEWRCSRCGQIITVENIWCKPEDHYCKGCGAAMQVEYRK